MSRTSGTTGKTPNNICIIKTPLGNPRGVLVLSESVSRVLLKTTIYLDPELLQGSSRLLRTTGPVMCSPTALLRIEFTASTCLHAMGELLPRLSTLTDLLQSRRSAVYLCCTCPRVTPGGRYPLSLPCGARTFLTHRLSPYARGRSANSLKYSIHFISLSQQNLFLSYTMKRFIMY